MKQPLLLFGILLVFFFSISTLAYATVSGVQSYYKFDSNYRDSLNALNCFNDSPTQVINNNTLILGNGSLQYFNQGGGPHGLFCGLRTIPSSYTFAGWIYFRSGSSAYDRTFFGWDSNGTNAKSLAFGYYSGKLRLFVRNQSQASWVANVSGLNEETWYHIAVTRTPLSTPTFYINGVEYTGVITAGTVNESLAGVNDLYQRIGATFTNVDTAQLEGRMDEWGYWNKVLSAEDIQTLYNSGLGQTYPLQSLNNLYGFSVQQNSSFPYGSVQKVIINYSQDTNFFYYALSCNVNDEAVWNERFTYNYNFTTQNVSIGQPNPESYLTFNGLQTTIGASFPQLDIQKSANEGTRAISSDIIRYTTSSNNLVDFIRYDSANRITYWLQFNKTGNNLSIYKYFFGNTQFNQNIANVTLTNGVVNLKITYIPVTDSENNINYFTTTIYQNNVSLVSDSTYQYDGTNLKDAEFFTQSNATTLTVQQLGFYLTNNPFPEFVGFQNSGLEMEDGFTFYSPAPETEIQGDGFVVKTGSITTGQLTLLSNGLNFYQAGNSSQSQFLSVLLGANLLLNPFISLFQSTLTSQEFQDLLTFKVSETVGGNNVFFSECTYPTVGTYTQRHFISVDGSSDYTNFRDLVVVIGNTSEGTNVTPPTFDTGLPSEPITDAIDGVFSNTGWDGVGFRMIAGFVILVAVLIGIFQLPMGTYFKVLLGAIWLFGGLIAGFLFKFFQFWVVLLLIIFCAGILAMFWKRLTSDSEAG